MAVRKPAIVLKAYPFASISARKSHILFIGQTTGSSDCSRHQEIHVLRFDDIVREEFVSIADTNRLIVFCEKPFFSYRVLRACTRGDSILGSERGLESASD